MGYAAAPRVAFIVYGIQTFFTAIIIIIINDNCINKNFIYKFSNTLKFTIV